MHQAASMEIRLLKFFNWIHLHSMISLLELSITLTSILHCFRFNGSCMKVVFGTRQHHRISKLAMPWRLAQGWVTFRIWTIVHCVESNRMCSDYLCCQRIAISISVRKYSLVKVRRLKYSVQKEGLIYVSREGRSEGPSLIDGKMAEGDIDCICDFLPLLGQLIIIV